MYYVVRHTALVPPESYCRVAYRYLGHHARYFIRFLRLCLLWPVAYAGGRTRADDRAEAAAAAAGLSVDTGHGVNSGSGGVGLASTGSSTQPSSATMAALIAEFGGVTCLLRTQQRRNIASL